jgi:hypothetical protein
VISYNFCSQESEYETGEDDCFHLLRFSSTLLRFEGPLSVAEVARASVDRSVASEAVSREKFVKQDWLERCWIVLMRVYMLMRSTVDRYKEDVTSKNPVAPDSAKQTNM